VFNAAGPITLSDLRWSAVQTRSSQPTVRRSDGRDFQRDRSLARRLIQMAIAFAVHHPAVTSAIIGPRTMEHLDSYLAADGITLSSDVLDRIDEIVPPAATIEVTDNYWQFGTRSLEPRPVADKTGPEAALSADRTSSPVRSSRPGLSAG
jgi:hypothetical protein